MFDDQKRRSALSGGHNVARRTFLLYLLAIFINSTHYFLYRRALVFIVRVVLVFFAV